MKRERTAISFRAGWAKGSRHSRLSTSIHIEPCLILDIPNIQLLVSVIEIRIDLSGVGSVRHIASKRRTGYKLDIKKASSG
jgi:hypothetical protein